MRKKKTIVDLIGALFLALFLYTSLDKITGMRSFIRVVSKSPLLSHFAGVVAWGIPTVEIIIVGFLFIPATRRWGLWASFMLMMFFTIYVIYMVAFVPSQNLPCGCGGLFNSITWVQHIWINIILTILAYAALLIDKRNQQAIDTPNDHIQHQISPL